jgi:hypothetical protein
MDALPTSAIDPLATECALAALGLLNVLNAEPEWTATARHVAANIPKSIKDSISKLMTGADRPEASDNPKYDHDKVGKLLAAGPQEKQALALHKAIPDQTLALGVAATVTRQVHQLQPQYPRPTRLSAVAGLQPAPSTPASERSFARIWNVATFPLIVFRDLLEGSLTPDMVRAFETLWPNLYQLTLITIDNVYASLKAKRPKFELTGAVDRKIGMLKGMTTSTSNLPLAAALQAVAGPTKVPAPPTPRSNAINMNLSTPGSQPASDST